MAQTHRCASLGNVQAALDLGTWYLWGNRTLISEECFAAAGLTMVQQAVDLLMAARGDYLPITPPEEPQPLLQVQMLAHEYLVLVHLSKLALQAPLYPTDTAAVLSLVPLSMVANPAVPDRLISRSIVAYHRHTGVALATDCYGAQAVFVYLAQLGVLDSEATGALGGIDVQLWDTFEDMHAQQDLHERANIAEYMKCVLLTDAVALLVVGARCVLLCVFDTLQRCHR